MAECYIVQNLSSAVRTGTGRANSVSDYSFWWTSGRSNYKYTVTIPNVSGIKKVKWQGNFYFDMGDYRYSSSCTCLVQKNGTTIAQGVGETELSVSAGDVLTVTITIGATMLSPGSTRGVSPMSITYDKMRFTTTVELPTISEMQYASEVNKLASILGVSSVTANADIAISGVQAIGTAIGNMKTTWDGSGSATAVTFNTGEAKKSDINACVTNMTGNYAIRETIGPADNA